MKWISVAERLPDLHEERWESEDLTYLISDAVLVWNGERIDLAWVEVDDDDLLWSDYNSGADIDGVTHWQALPKPPKEAKR